MALISLKNIIYDDKRRIIYYKIPSKKKGREQEGIRPGIIIADTKTDLILVIPLTSNLEASKNFLIHLSLKIRRK